MSNLPHVPRISRDIKLTELGHVNTTALSCWQFNSTSVAIQLPARTLRAQCRGIVAVNLFLSPRAGGTSDLFATPDHVRSKLYLPVSSRPITFSCETPLFNALL
jgi:hypothetical protein